jgi:hypothetical protein
VQFLLLHRINPIVGCFEEPRPDPTENMSDEQKEYEAVKLVEKIDQLSRFAFHLYNSINLHTILLFCT